EPSASDDSAREPIPRRKTHRKPAALAPDRGPPTSAENEIFESILKVREAFATPLAPAATHPQFWRRAQGEFFPKPTETSDRSRLAPSDKSARSHSKKRMFLLRAKRARDLRLSERAHRNFVPKLRRRGRRFPAEGLVS